MFSVWPIRLEQHADFFCFFPWASVLISAFGGTALAFGCFSAAAMLAKRREYLYLGGLVSSGLSMLLWLQFASSIFGGSAAMYKFEVRNYLSVSNRNKMAMSSFTLVG